jgi:predicted nucleic acid-binding protein
MEVSYGLAKAALRDDAIIPAQAWFTRLVTSDLVVAHPLDESAAVVAGRLRAKHPLPPSAPRARTGTKPNQRAGWVLDIQIAACAWTSGSSVRTENLRDFELLRDLIDELYPGTTALQVYPAPDVKVNPK